MFCFFCVLGLSADVETPVDLGATDVRSERAHSEAFVAQTDPEATAALTLADLARRLPAVNLRETGGSFAFTTLSLRGSTATQAAIYLDGVPLAASSVGAVDLSTLLALDLGKVEVYRGFAPAELGPDGLFGALVLHTRDDGEGYRSSVGAGSFGTRQLAAAWSGRVGAGHLSLSAIYAGTNGDFSYLDDNGTPLNRTDDRLAVRQNNDQNASTLRAVYTRSIAAGALWRAALMLYGKDQGTPPPVSQTSTARYQLLRPQLVLGVEHWRFAPRALLDINLQWLTHAARISDTAVNSFTDTIEQEQDLRLNVVARYAALPRLHFVASLLGSASDYAEVGLATRAFSERWQGGGSLAAQWRPLDALELGLSSRFDGAVDRGASGDRTHFWPQPELSLNAQALSWLSLAAHGGYRERLPTFAERFGEPGLVRGNLALQSESVWQADAGLRFAHRFANLELVYSEAVAHDLVVFVLGPVGLPQAQNIGSANIQTLEATGALTPWRYLALDFNYTFQYARNGSAGVEHDKPLAGRPEHYGRAALIIYTPWHLRFMYEFIYVGDTYLDRDGSDLVPGRYPQNLRVAWQPFGGRVIVSLDVTNAFDQTTARVALPLYQTSVVRPIVDFLGYPLPGRSVFATITYAFGDDRTAREKTICASAC